MAVMLLDQLRQAVNESGQSRNAISVAVGVNPSVISRFMAGGGLEVRTAEAIAGYLGFTVELKVKGTVIKRTKRPASKG